ncbi:MAG: GreA/GreB family elongation factor [Candidatus Eremiobacteraeota bacterium]|nr:GreA/GreB family elongation factor [Candidatus Eremiobacteraeota bacterium]
MSRAFVKDDSGGPEPVIERPVTDGPNYVTPGGLERLKQALAQAESVNNEREIRYYSDRIDTAIVVDPKSKLERIVEFGAEVTAHDNGGAKLRVRIVGADEADPVHGTISYESPIARAFAGHHEGERVVVRRPAGPIEYTIDKIAYK